MTLVIIAIELLVPCSFAFPNGGGAVEPSRAPRKHVRFWCSDSSRSR